MPRLGNSREHATVSIPPEQLDAVRTAVLELYQVCADALNHDATRHLRTGDKLESVRSRRSNLAVFDRMFEEIGWPGEPATKSPVTLSGPRVRLHEVVWVALSRAVSILDESCREYWHGGSELDELASDVEDVQALFALLAELEARSAEEE